MEAAACEAAATTAAAVRKALFIWKEREGNKFGWKKKKREAVKGKWEIYTTIVICDTLKTRSLTFKKGKQVFGSFHF